MSASVRLAVIRGSLLPFQDHLVSTRSVGMPLYIWGEGGWKPTFRVKKSATFRLLDHGADQVAFLTR
jgi:hypothetical protein